MTLLETERLHLREFTIDDAEAVLELSQNPEVTRYTGDAGLATTIEDAKRIITDITLPEYKKHGYGRMAVVDKETGRVIGFCGLKYLDDMQEVDIGYRLLPEFWGRGLATEAGLEVMRHGREVLKIDSIIGMVLPDNMASHRVLEKLGLQKAEQIMEEDVGLVQVYRWSLE